ncbi:MAG: hypothetical protein ACI97A_003594 [Planctomycetota bacterium]|jgi:uncharacterized protein (TIGR03643 family)
MTQSERDHIIRMAWKNRTCFDEIKVKTGLTESEVVKFMRQQLKRSAFRR